MHKQISVIVPCLKGDFDTLSSLDSCPCDYELIVSRKSGLGYARNFGAKKASNEFLVFFDSDLRLNPEVWDYIFSVKRGEFALTWLHGYPSSRVFVIHKKDFFAVGGFDESLVFQGEDRDFFARALDAKLRFFIIPLELIEHVEHPRRYENIHVAIGFIREDIKLLKKYWIKYPEVFNFKVFTRIRNHQFRSVLLEAMFMLYYFVLG